MTSDQLEIRINAIRENASNSSDAMAHAMLLIAEVLYHGLEGIRQTMVQIVQAKQGGDLGDSPDSKVGPQA